MNNDEIKKMLLDIEESELDFTVTLSGKESKKVNGLYKPDTREIILHNKNFKTENQMVYTAIHEYTHHKMNEIQIKTTNMPLKGGKSHTNAFWATFHRLLEIAEQKKLYTLEIETSPELAQVTEEIRKNYLEQDGKLMIEFGKLLVKAHNLCQEANIRYEDYIDRVLQLPRAAAKTLTKIGVSDLNPSIGYENMKMVASLPKGDKQALAQEQILAGKSPDTVRSMMKRRAEQIDQKSQLEKEKIRLEKTIASLSNRLEQVEDTLAHLD